MLLASHYGTVASAGGVQPRYVFTATGTTPYLEAWTWPGQWGTKYANPAVSPGDANDLAVTDTTDAIATTLNASPYVAAYQWSDAGFGTKYANPGTAVLNQGAGISWQPGNANIVIGNRTTTPYVQAYAWTYAGGFGSKYANPATVTANSTYDVNFGTSYIARSNSGSSNIEAFLWSSGWSTRYTKAEANSVQPIRWVTSAAADVLWTPTVSPYVRAAPFAAGFGVTYTAPVTAPAGIAYGLASSTAGDQVAVAHTTSPYITAYPFSAGWGTKYANPATLPAGNGRSVSIYGETLVVGHSTSPFVSAYGFTASGFGGKYADPAVLPAAQVTGIQFGR